MKILIHLMKKPPTKVNVPDIKVGQAPNITRDRAKAATRLFEDYFAQPSRFDSEDFRIIFGCKNVCSCKYTMQFSLKIHITSKTLMLVGEDDYKIHEE